MSVKATPRQAQIMDLICAGLRYREIGQRLGIRERTVEKHIELLRRELGFAGGNRLAHIAWWMRRGVDR